MFNIYACNLYLKHFVTDGRPNIQEISGEFRVNPDSVKSTVTHLLRDATEVCLCTVEKMCYFLES